MRVGEIIHLSHSLPTINYHPERLIVDSEWVVPDCIGLVR